RSVSSPILPAHRPAYLPGALIQGGLGALPEIQALVRLVGLRRLPQEQDGFERFPHGLDRRVGGFSEQCGPQVSGGGGEFSPFTSPPRCRSSSGGRSSNKDRCREP